MDMIVEFLIGWILGFKDFIFNGILIMVLINQKLDFKKILNISLIMCTLSVVLSAMPFFQDKRYILLPLANICFIILQHFIFKISWVKAVLVGLFIYVFLLLIDYPVAITMKSVFNISFEESSSNFFLYIGSNILFNIFEFLFTYIIYKTKLRITIDLDNIHFRKFMPIIVNLVLIVVMIFVNAYFLILTFNNSHVELLIFNLVAGIILLVITAYNSMNNNKLILKEQELQYEKLYSRTLGDLVDGLRTFKHDYANVLNCINAYVDLNDMDGIRRYFKDVLKDYKDVSSIGSVADFISKNPAIYGLVTAKIYKAQSLKINANVLIMSDLKSPCISNYHISKILGILFDNAIEECEKTDDKILRINICENHEESNYCITIENSTINEVDIKKIYEKGISSKGENRGIGLWEVRKIVNKYENVSLITTYKDHIFCQKLCFEKLV